MGIFCGISDGRVFVVNAIRVIELLKKTGLEI